MANTFGAAIDQRSAAARPGEESSHSAVSWAAIFAGAAAAGALTLVLVALGSALGFATLSPWARAGSVATAWTAVTAIWLIVIQWLSSGVGGYIAGRLRTKWTGANRDEIFFRDTAHGFVAWAVASLAVAWLATSAAGALVSGGAQVAASAASGAGSAAVNAAASSTGIGDRMESLLDTMLRPTTPNPAAPASDARAEVGRILTSGLATGDLSPADRTYLGQVVASRTGLAQADAERRVDEAVAQYRAAETQAREAADTARKAAAYTGLFTALSMMIGAFIACAAAALGGHHRDEI